MFNSYGTIIIMMILIKFALDVAANLLNIKALGGEVPEEFKGLFNEETYKKSQQYTIVRTKFELFNLAVGLLVLFAFWFGGGFGMLDSYLRNFGFHKIVTGVLFIGFLSLGQYLISLLFSAYSIFIIEEHFGFNKTTVKTFVLDCVKEIFLSVIIGSAVLTVVLWFFEYAGRWAWFYAWVFVSFFSIVFTFLGPRLIMPFFLKFTPLGEGELKESIMALARKLDFPVEGIFVIDGSRRSNKTNAFFTGFGKHKRIALYDTLIAQHTVPELVSVLAHEIGHYKKKHVLRGLILGLVYAGVVFLLFSLFVDNVDFFKAFGLVDLSVYAGLVIFMISYVLIAEIGAVWGNIIQRKHEYEADNFAKMVIDDPESLVNGLKKLSRDNISNLNPHPFYVFLNYSHPTVLERIKKLRNNI